MEPKQARESSWQAVRYVAGTCSLAVCISCHESVPRWTTAPHRDRAPPLTSGWSKRRAPASVSALQPAFLSPERQRELRPRALEPTNCTLRKVFGRHWTRAEPKEPRGPEDPESAQRTESSSDVRIRLRLALHYVLRSMHSVACSSGSCKRSTAITSFEFIGAVGSSSSPEAHGTHSSTNPSLRPGIPCSVCCRISCNGSLRAPFSSGPKRARPDCVGRNSARALGEGTESSSEEHSMSVVHS